MRDGDLRKLAQIQRKQALKDLFDENGIEAPVVYSEHLIGDGQEMFEHAAKLNWEESSRKERTPRTGRTATKPARRSKPCRR